MRIEEGTKRESMNQCRRIGAVFPSWMKRPYVAPLIPDLLFELRTRWIPCWPC